MTKTVIMEKTLLSVKCLNRYNERFPIGGGGIREEINSPLSSRRRFVSCPPSPTHRRSLGDISPGNGGNLVDGMSRRHTLGQCHFPPRSPVSIHTNKLLLNNNINSGLSDSRRSSGASSVIEVIEECESDEEIDDEESTNAGYDYIRCINCSRSNSTSSLDRTAKTATKSTSEPHLPQQIVNFCYNCRHLNPNPHLPAFYEGRRSSWTAGENVCYSPRNSRRSSLSNSASELPIISEPSFDEETNDTLELKLRVEREVDRLTKLNNNKNIMSKQQSFLPFTKHLSERLDRKTLMMSLRETNL